MKTTNFFLTAICLLVFALNITAQENTVSPEWQHVSMINTGGMYAKDMEKDPFDNVYVASEFDAGNGNFDVSINKYSPTGQMLWQATWGNSDNQPDKLKAIDVDAQGNVYVAVQSFIGNYNTYWTINSYTPSGVQYFSKWFMHDSGGISYPTDISFYQGNIYVCGVSSSSAQNTCNGWVLLKLDMTGYQESMVTYYRDNMWQFRSQANPVEMEINPNTGEIYVGGWSTNIYNQTHYELIKYNSSCVQIWRKDYSYQGLNTASENVITAIDYQPSGGVVVTGYCEVPNSGNDWITIQYDSSGSQQWVHRKNAPGNVDDKPYDLITDGLGNVLITGYITDVSDKNMHTMKLYGASGMIAWEQSYNSPNNNNDIGTAITVGANNEVFAIGTVGPTNENVALIKYNTSGAQQYFKRYDRGYSDKGVDVEVYQVSGRSNIYVAMSSQDLNGTYRFESVLVKWSGPGSTVTLPVTGPGNYNFNVGGINTAINLALNSMSGTGSITTNLFRNFSINNQFTGGTPNYLSNYRWLIEQTGLSNLQGTMNIVLNQLPNHGITNGNAINIFKRALDGSSAFEQLATTFSNGVLSALINGFSEFMLGSDTDPILVQENNTSVPKEYVLHQNYPNPFNPSTKIRFEIATESQTNLVVYDMLGREVAVLFDEFLKPGTYSINFTGENLSSGTYFYTLSGEGFKLTQRMVLVK